MKGGFESMNKIKSNYIIGQRILEDNTIQGEEMRSTVDIAVYICKLEPVSVGIHIWC